MSTDYRRESRMRWQQSAAGWQRQADRLFEASMPVTAAMLDAIAPQPGHNILELAAGLGDVGFLAAELVEPCGTLICSDLVPEMLSAAQERARERGIANVRFKQIDAHSIDLPAGSVDGVLCRWGFMLMADPQAGLRETRRVLRPGGRVALAAWAGPEDNPWSTLIHRALEERGLRERADPDAPGQFFWGPEGRIVEELASVGFVEYEVQLVDFAMRFASFDDWWNAQMDLSASRAEILRSAEPATVAQIRDVLLDRSQPFAAPDGALVLPARTWVAMATA